MPLSRDSANLDFLRATAVLSRHLAQRISRLWRHRNRDYRCECGHMKSADHVFRNGEYGSCLRCDDCPSYIPEWW